MGLESKVVEDIQKDNLPLIDREKTCPLLLRVFCSLTGRHNNRNEFSRGMPSNELQIYTWLDATLKELTRLITEVYPNTKTKGTTFNFMVVWPNPRTPGFGMKEIGTTTIGSKGPDDNSTLQSKKFVIGDYLDVAISVARSNASSSAYAGSSGGGGGGGDRRGERDRDRDRDRDGRDNRDSKSDSRNNDNRGGRGGGGSGRGGYGDYR